MTNPIPRRADNLFNDVLLPDETRALRREIRQFADDVVGPAAHRLNTTPESRDSFPRDLFDAMARAGLYAIPFAADVGGRGLEFPTLATVTVLEELGYYSRGLASALYDGQAILVGQTLDRAGAALRQRYLPKLVRGEFVGSFATSEPEASTDLSPANMQTVATRSDGGWRIDGKKRWITNSVAADYIAVLCRTGERQTFFFADMHADGVSVGDPDLKMGNHAQLTADVTFDDVFVPDDHVIGQVDGGLRAALGALMLGRMGIGAIGVAMAQAAFDFATDYIGRRKVFGQPVGAFQHWQFRFADHAMGLENARSLYQKAALLYDRSGQAETEAAMAKVAGSELAVEVARDAIQSCGAYGFVRTLRGTGADFPLESIYRDAKIGEIYEGANEVQRWVVARRIFGRDITG
ncbi:TPA: acyl-CoA dehydrogenase family protein [Escherichia coli]|uniref:acyl-CoA dehydrogenase family protein n=1 Tax=Pseudomonadota TaxID=1224 RepID=UPI00287C3007|nr:acyl-CoA dehydrogenase family protein [Escherichia coli]HEA1240613.1 acyl-CoA dehydrogenase family protein [Escherichia coli]HEA1932960.1 acyl-CoA dehydrogenase family protein [Escherichia coli]HEA2340381.1 acyl-CoA dehydrogenase family protein [Escherichia coli]